MRVFRFRDKSNADESGKKREQMLDLFSIKMKAVVPFVFTQIPLLDQQTVKMDILEGEIVKKNISFRALPEWGEVIWAMPERKHFFRRCSLQLVVVEIYYWLAGWGVALILSKFEFKIFEHC